MAHILHITSNHHKKNISQDEAAEMVRVCGIGGATTYWRDMLGGKILEFATIRLDNHCGTIEVGYANKSATRRVATEITDNVAP
jgi:hypothetical protein